MADKDETPTPLDIHPVDVEEIPETVNERNANVDANDADVDADGGWILTLDGERIPRREYVG